MRSDKQKALCIMSKCIALLAVCANNGLELILLTKYRNTDKRIDTFISCIITDAFKIPDLRNSERHLMFRYPSEQIPGALIRNYVDYIFIRRCHTNNSNRLFTHIKKY